MKNGGQPPFYINMKITVVRHGETTHNANDMVIGHGQGKLSSRGEKQVVLLGKALKTKKFDMIYCSDLKRCKDTLKAIQKYHKRIPVIFTPEIRERSFGIFEGRPRSLLGEALARHKGSRMAFKPKNAESLNEMKARIRKFIHYLKNNHSGENILIVAHSGVLRMFESILNQISVPKLFKTVKFQNTGICEYDVQGKRVKTLAFNDASHLPEHLKHK